MSQQYYNTAKTAEILKLSPADVNQLREEQKLRAFRDGADWKFKTSEVNDYLVEMVKQRRQDSASEEVVSEVEVGPSDAGSSGTVIGAPLDDVSAADSDLKLAESDIGLGDDLELAEGVLQLDDEEDEDSETVSADMALAAADLGEGSDIDLTIDEDVSLEESSIGLAGDAVNTGEGSGSSAVDLPAEEDIVLDDDDLVLGGSGSGSDITIGGDSGISLVDPHDSGLSLDEPLEFAGGSSDSLELGEDDMLTLGDDVDTEASTELKPDDDFLLTPLDEGADDDSESGSQVIALEEEEELSFSPEASGPALGAGLDEAAPADATLDFSPAPVVEQPVGEVETPAAAATFSEAAMAAGPGSGAMPEAPYSGLMISVGLAPCVLFLSLAGWMTYDLIRNMWSWDTPYALNSSIMDLILGLFG